MKTSDKDTLLSTLVSNSETYNKSFKKFSKYIHLQDDIKKYRDVITLYNRKSEKRLMTIVPVVSLNKKSEINIHYKKSKEKKKKNQTSNKSKLSKSKNSINSTDSNLRSYENKTRNKNHNIKDEIKKFYCNNISTAYSLNNEFLAHEKINEGNPRLKITDRFVNSIIDVKSKTFFNKFYTHKNDVRKKVDSNKSIYKQNRKKDSKSKFNSKNSIKGLPHLGSNKKESDWTKKITFGKNPLISKKSSILSSQSISLQDYEKKYEKMKFKNVSKIEISKLINDKAYYNKNENESPKLIHEDKNDKNDKLNDDDYDINKKKFIKMESINKSIDIKDKSMDLFQTKLISCLKTKNINKSHKHIKIKGFTNIDNLNTDVNEFDKNKIEHHSKDNNKVNHDKNLDNSTINKDIDNKNKHFSKLYNDYKKLFYSQKVINDNINNTTNKAILNTNELNIDESNIKCDKEKMKENIIQNNILSTTIQNNNTNLKTNNLSKIKFDENIQSDKIPKLSAFSKIVFNHTVSEKYNKDKLPLFCKKKKRKNRRSSVETINSIASNSTTKEIEREKKNLLNDINNKERIIKQLAQFKNKYKMSKNELQTLGQANKFLMNNHIIKKFKVNAYDEYTNIMGKGKNSIIQEEEGFVNTMINLHKNIIENKANIIVNEAFKTNKNLDFEEIEFNLQFYNHFDPNFNINIRKNEKQQKVKKEPIKKDNKADIDKIIYDLKLPDYDERFLKDNFTLNFVNEQNLRRISGVVQFTKKLMKNQSKKDRVEGIDVNFIRKDKNEHDILINKLKCHPRAINTKFKNSTNSKYKALNGLTL